MKLTHEPVSTIQKHANKAHYRGEEFLLLLPGSNLAATHRRAEELRQAVEDLAVPSSQGCLTITVSLGIAAYPNHGREMDVLIRQADNNLYLAKNSGRNQVIG